MSPGDSLATYCRTRTSGGSCGVPAFSRPDYVIYLRCSTIPPVVSLAIPLAQYLSIRFFLYFLYQYTCVYRKKSVPLQSLYRSFIWYIKSYSLIPKIPRRYPEDRHEKMVERILDFYPCFRRYLLPNLCRHPTHQIHSQLLNIFNISKSYIPTFLHIFMCEITIHTAQLPKSHSSKIDDFLGGIGVVYNYIHSIYYIFFDRYTIRLFFLCRNVGM